MRVFGIDPGSRFMGYGVVEDLRGRPVHVSHGVIRVDPEAPLETRLHQLHQALVAALVVYRPDTVAVEGVFTFRNSRSALILGHARGVALLAVAQQSLPVFEYAPAHVKRAVGAGGAGAKDAVGRMVRTLLGIETNARADATDALAVALCHLHRGNSILAGVNQRTAPSRRSVKGLLGARLSSGSRRPEVRG